MQISEEKATGGEKGQTGQSNGNQKSGQSDSNQKAAESDPKQKPEDSQVDNKSVDTGHKPVGKFSVGVDWKRVSKKSFTGLARLKDELQTDSFSIPVREKPLRSVEFAIDAHLEEWQDIGELVGGVNYFLSARGTWTPDTASGNVKSCGAKGTVGTNFIYYDKPKFSLVLQFVPYDGRPPEIFPNCVADAPMFTPPSNGMLRGRINGETDKFAGYKGRILVSAIHKSAS